LVIMTMVNSYFDHVSYGNLHKIVILN